jgi:hypothetical protein
MQFPTGKPSVGVIYDSGLGTRIDEALAFSLLYGLDGKNECRVVATSVSKANLKAAALCEVIGRFYAGAVSGAFAAFARTLPVGMADDGVLPADTPMLTVPLARPEHTHGIQKLTDTAEVAPLLRNALTAQHDDNAMMVCAGPFNNMAALLALPGAKEWIVRKSRYLVAVVSDEYLKIAPEAARKVFAEWPTPVFVVGDDVGKALPFPGASIEKDFAWSPAHPVADAYKAAGPMPYDAPAPAMAAVLYAVRPDKGFFQVSEPGTFAVSANGTGSFTPSAAGKHKRILVDPAKKDLVLATYIELASAKPVVRQPRRRRPVVEEPAKKKEAAPPAAPATPETKK